MQLLEEARTLIEGELGETFFNSVDELIEDNIGELEGVYNFNNEGIWFLNSEWKVKDEPISEKYKPQEFYGRYNLTNYETELNNNWWISNFFTNNNDHMCFYFDIFYYLFKNRPLKNIWKKFAQDRNEEYQKIEEAGFKFNAIHGNWYLPIAGLDATVVAENYTNETLKDALIPIVDALEKLKEAHPYFNKIVQEAIEKFGKVELDE